MRKTTLLLTLAYIVTLPSAYADNASQYTALPGAVHLDGVGSLYGGIAGVKDIGINDYNIYVGVARGDGDVFGLAINDIPLWRGQFSYIYAQANDLTIETQYQRGADTGRIYEQDLSGNIHRFALTHKLPVENLTSTVSFTRSSVSLDGYADEDGRDITFNQSNLHDVNTTSFAAELTWDNRSGPVGLRSGSKISTALKIDTGRTGQSDQGTFEYKLSHHIDIGLNALASFYLNGSHAFIISQATKFDTAAEVVDTLNAQCDQLSGQQQTSCVQLESDLATYIADSNSHGTAKAIGGSQGLRSYQESFFRGANSIVEGAELQWQLPNFLQITDAAKLQWVAFAEGAQISDNFNKLTSNSRYSVGTGLRAYVGDIPARLEFSHGEDGNTFLLSAGLVF